MDDDYCRLFIGNTLVECLPDAGFESLSVVDLRSWGRVCSRARQSVIRYFKSRRFFYRVLHRWFTLRECSDLLHTLRVTSSLLSGSAVLALYTGESWDGSMSLRWHVTASEYPNVRSFLEGVGFWICDAPLIAAHFRYVGLDPSTEVVHVFYPPSAGREAVWAYHVAVVVSTALPPLGTVLRCSSLSTMICLSSSRICCLANDWIDARVLPRQRDAFMAPDAPQATRLMHRGWAVRSAVESVHPGYGAGGARVLFDSLCTTYRFSDLTDGLGGFEHRWADLVLRGGRFYAEVAPARGRGHTELMSCRDPIFSRGL